MKFRWRVRHKLAIGLGLIVVMTGLLSTGSFYGLWSYRKSNHIFNHHQTQLERLGNLVLAVSELHLPYGGSSEHAPESPPSPESATRILMDRLDLIETIAAKYEQGLDELPEGLVDDADNQQLRAQLDDFNRKVADLKRAASSDEPVAEVNRTRTSWWYVDHKRDVIAGMINSLNRIRGMTHERVTNQVMTAANDYRLSLAVVCSTSVLVLVLLFVLVWFGYRAIFHPIRELHRGVTTLADGNFDSRVELDSGDEMQELGEAFNAMADRLQGIYSELNRKVEERSRQLIRSERLASVGFLAAGVAHEINNPLASIAFCGEALESRLQPFLGKQGDDQEVVRNYLQMIQQEAFRCKAITEKLLDYSRVGEPERIETDIVGLIRNVIEMVEHIGRSKHKNVVFHPRQAIIASVNPQELKQVLLNLIVNGLEAVDEDGTVTITAGQDGDSVSIAVVDNGYGMSEDVLENLFEPFFTRNRTGKGTGLGLSISHLIISQHGGTLSARSAGPQKGSTFTIQLPVEAKALAA